MVLILLLLREQHADYTMGCFQMQALDRLKA